MLTKNVLLNSYSSMKKNEKDSYDFWHRKLTLKVKFWHFLTARHHFNSPNLVISFDYSWFLAKNLSSFVSLLWKLHNRYCHNCRSLLTASLLWTSSGKPKGLLNNIWTKRLFSVKWTLMNLLLELKLNSCQFIHIAAVHFCFGLQIEPNS